MTPPTWHHQLNRRTGCLPFQRFHSLQLRQTVILGTTHTKRYIRVPSKPPTHPAIASFSLLGLHTTTPATCHFHYRIYLSYSLDMSSSPVKFNLGNNYPFMDHTKGQIPTPPQPSQYPQGVPSTHYHNHHPQKPQSLPDSQPPSPLAAPMPQYPPPQMVASDSASSTSSASSVSSSRGHGIFTLYQPDRSRTPELEHITKKKATWSGK